MRKSYVSKDEQGKITGDDIESLFLNLITILFNLGAILFITCFTINIVK